MPKSLSDAEIVRVERQDAQGPFIVVCEHAANTIPREFDGLGLSEADQQAHIAWDPGALGVAAHLAALTDAPLVRAGISRLIYDLNRPPQSPGAMASRSEATDIPGNRGLTPEERLRRTRGVYLPFHQALRDEIAARLALGQLGALITVHSFTPVYFGEQREVELGIIHDHDDRLARALLDEAIRDGSLRCALNEPYSAADGVAHTLALHANPMGLPHVMIEIRNDLIATRADQERIAAMLAGCLTRAFAQLKEPTCPAG